MSKRVLTAIMALAIVAPASAGAGDFALVNGTGAGISNLSIRRHGTAAWSPLPNALSPGAFAMIKFSGEDCAYDIRASVAGNGEVVWSGLNLCEVNRVTLRRAPSGTSFASYD